MNTQSQTGLAVGIGAVLVAVIGGYLLFGPEGGEAKPAAAAAPASTAGTGGEYADAIAAATASAVQDGGAGLSADEAKRIGEEVARQVAAQVAQAIVDEKIAAGSGGGGGLSEADARRIGEEEGRRVAQEVAASTIQQALAAAGGGGGSGLTAAEAEQIGLAAGRRAARQVAANAAREVVRNEFGGQVAAKAESGAPAVEAPADAQADAPTDAPAEAPVESAAAPAAAAPSESAAASRAPGASADALRAWWTPPAGGDFGIVYAGQPKGGRAIALLFSPPPAHSALGQSVKVYDAKGALVGGAWEAAANPRLAVLRGLAPGRYTVVVDAALADASGKLVNKRQHGPVYVI